MSTTQAMSSQTGIKKYTVAELITALQGVAKNSPKGNATPVRIGDWEGNLVTPYGMVETLEVKYDPETLRVVIYCDLHEC